MKRANLALILGIVGLALSSAGVVLAVSTDGSSSPPASDAHLITRPQPAAVQPGLARRFGVLRRERRASDAMPRSARVLANDPDTPNTTGSNGGLGRDSGAGPKGTRIFVVPGDGAVCVVADAPEPGGSSDIATGGCADLSAAEAGTFVHGSYGGPFSAADEVLAYGLVPDGVSAVAIENGAGEKRSVDVTGNVYAARIRDKSPVVVRFGSTTVEVP
jgi:hypothetical protein